MQNELSLVWSFIRAIFKDWIGWMSGGGGLALTIGAQFMSELASPAWFWALGAAALLFACYRAWKLEHGTMVDRKERFQLLTIIDEGERRIKAYDQMRKGGDARIALEATGKLQAWFRETLNFVKQSHATYWDHFKDLGYFGEFGVDDCREQSDKLLVGLRHLISSATQS